MTWWKNGLLLAAGGAVGLIAGALLCETTFDEEKDGSGRNLSEEAAVQALMTKIRREAMSAMEECETDEEREAVYSQVKQSIQETQELLAQKGEELIAELQKQAMGASNDNHRNPEMRVQNIKDTLRNLTDSLDETLASLKPITPETAM